MSEPPALASPLGPAELVEIDLPCVSCGYNLRGLPTNHRCPECNAVVDTSLRGDLLLYADTGWLRKVRRGTIIFLWNVVVRIVMTTLTGVTGLLVFATLLAIASGGMDLWGTLLVTSQEPRISLGEQSVTLRRFIRVCAMVSFCGTLAGAAPAIGDSLEWGAIVAFLAGLGSLVSFAGVLVYLRRFGRRIPEPKLVRSTTIVLWGYAISLGVIFTGGVLTELFAPSPAGVAPAPPPGSAFGGAIGSTFVMCFGGVGMAVFGLWTLVILDRYRRAFGLIIKQAESEPAIEAAVDHTAGIGPPIES